MIIAWPLQKAAFGALDGQLTGPVYDEVPDDAEDTLYSVIGETTDVPDDTHDEDGNDETLLIHTWGNDPEDRSSRPVKEQMAEIDAVLHHATLVLEGGGSVFLTRVFAEVLKEEDPETGETWRHGVQRYRARTLEAA